MARASVEIDSGPVEATDQLRHVPQEKWRLLMQARRSFLKVRLDYDCRCLVEFVNDAKEMFEVLGYSDAEEMIREGYELDPKKVEIAVEWLNLNKPDEPVSIDYVLGKHGGDRRSADFQGNNVTLKSGERGNGTNYTLARLDRDHPELAERVRAGELSANAAAIEAGFRKRPSPFEQVQKLIPKLTDEEREKLRGLLCTPTPETETEA